MKYLTSQNLVAKFCLYNKKNVTECETVFYMIEKNSINQREQMID